MAKVFEGLNIKQLYLHLETTTKEVYAQNLLGAQILVPLIVILLVLFRVMNKYSNYRICTS